MSRVLFCREPKKNCSKSNFFQISVEGGYEMRKNLKTISIVGVFLLLTSLATSALAAPPDQAESQKGIVELATEQGQFTTLLGALEQADLVDRLQGEGPFTVFAPTDEAFAQLPAGTVEDWFANTQALTDVLLYHVVEGRLTAADLAKLDTVESLTGKALDITVEGETVKVNGATVLTADLAGSNGIIHVIDTVLVPPTGAEIVTAEGSDTSLTQNPTAAGCAEDYVVQANDSLSTIADKYFGDIEAYQRIVEATNTAAADNQIYAVIDDPDVINVGQTLCIPGSPEAQTTLAGEEEATTPTASAAAAPDQTEIEIPEGKAALLFENYSFVDLVFDLSGPTPDTLVVVPDGKQVFILDPGQYNYNAHQPGGDFSVAPGTFELEAGQVVRLACSDSPVCAELPLDETIEPSAAAKK
jgi:uncharacterized surface protein with fasciclin (FAS1) repeats